MGTSGRHLEATERHLGGWRQPRYTLEASSGASNREVVFFYICWSLFARPTILAEQSDVKRTKYFQLHPNELGDESAQTPANNQLTSKGIYHNPLLGGALAGKSHSLTHRAPLGRALAIHVITHNTLCLDILFR